MWWKATAISIDPDTGSMVADVEEFTDFGEIMYAASSIRPFPFVPSNVAAQIHEAAADVTKAAENGDADGRMEAFRRVQEVEFGHDVRQPLTLVPLIPPGYREHVELEHPEDLKTFEMLAGSYIQVEPQDVPASA